MSAKRQYSFGLANVLKKIGIFLLLCSQSVHGQIEEISRIKQSLPSVRDSASYVDGLNRLAMLSHLRFRDSSLIYATKARNIAVRLNYQKGIADALNCQAIYYISLNDYLSTKYFNDALKIYQDLADQGNQAQVLTNMSIVMFVSGNKAEALKYIYEANAISRQLKNDSIRSIILSNILTMDKRISVKSAKIIYRQALNIAQKYKDTVMIISFENNQAHMLFNSGQQQKGIKILLNSLKKADRIGCEYIKVDAYVSLGDMMLEMGYQKEGVEYYKKGLFSAEKHGYPEIYLMLAQTLYDYYKSVNMPEKAFQYASLLLAKQNARSDSLKKSGFDYLSFVLKENELEKLRKEHQIRTISIMLVSSCLLLIVFVLFFVYRSLLNKKERLMVEKELNLVIKERNHDLQSTSNFQKVLISVIAHDVRQPLSSIVMLARIFNSPSFLNTQEKLEAMEELQYISSKTKDFMNGVMVWLKSREKGSEINGTVLNLKKTIIKANSFFVPQQKKNGLELIINLADDMIVTVQEEMILFVIRNLLNNATKFSPPGEKISISCTRMDHYVTISVSDNGAGMSSEQILKLFKSGLNHNVNMDKDAGMALNISYDLVQTMKGKIWVESQPLVGTTFFLKLPC